MSTKIECQCGGSLVQKDGFWVCEYCRSTYLIGKDDEGNPFIYHPIEKKHIVSGQMSAKASTISVNEVVVKEINLSETIDSEVATESLNISRYESIKLVKTFVEMGEWNATQEQINKLLVEDINCPEAKWYSLMCDHYCHNSDELIKRLSDFSQADCKNIDTILSYSSPTFAREIIDAFFAHGYLNDNMCKNGLQTIIPYARNVALYSKGEYEKKLEYAYDMVIEKRFYTAFEYLLSHTLSPDDVDAYIDYLLKFAEKCTSDRARKYYLMALAVDSGNLDIHRMLIEADIKSNLASEQMIVDFENLLHYATNTDSEVLFVANLLCQESKTTANKNDFMWQLLGYHSNAPEGLMTEILVYASVLLESLLFKQARDYYHLILTIDPKSGDAYFGLCLVKLEARNEMAISSKKENIIDLPEFKKSLALYQAANDKENVERLLVITKNQKSSKELKKFFFIAAMVIAAIILVVSCGKAIVKNQKYSVNRIDFEIASVGSVEEPLAQIPIQVENGCKLRTNISTVMTFYDGENNELCSTSVNFQGIEAKSEQIINVNLNYSAQEELYDYSFDELKVTIAITQVVYNDGSANTFEEPEERVLKKATKTKADKQKELDAQFETAMEAYDAVDMDSATYETELALAVEKFDPIWASIEKSEKYCEEMYDAAENYEGDNEYEKAYFLYSLLGTIEYKDSYNKAYDMQEYLNGNNYNY